MAENELHYVAYIANYYIMAIHEQIYKKKIIQNPYIYSETPYSGKVLCGLHIGHLIGVGRGSIQTTLTMLFISKFRVLD